MRPIGWRNAAAAGLLAVACASPTPTPSPAVSSSPTATGGGQASALPTAVTPSAASPSPSPSPGVMVVVAPVSVAANTQATVRLIDITGRVVASTQFTPRPAPQFSNCGDLLQPAVRVVAGAVYFADSAGAVHRMTADGSITTVATFALSNSQQYLSYAVSPDGSQLIAIVLSTPPLLNPPPQVPGEIFVAGGHWTLDLEHANAGGASVLALHRDLGTGFPTPTVITGWDSRGPTATLNTQLCTQAPLPSYVYTGTQLIHLGLDGTHLDTIGGPSCMPLDELIDGTVMCGQPGYTTGPYSFSVRRTDGSAIWNGQSGGEATLSPKLSPDGNAVAWGAVYARGSAQPASLPGQDPLSVALLGWVGTGRVLIAQQDGQLGLSPAVAPLAFHGLGQSVPGQALGTLTITPYLAGTIGIA